MSVCRSCGQVIDWIKTSKGKNMPLDPDYVQYDDAEIGDILVTDSGNVITVGPDNQPNMKGRISHFVTCPQASNWRIKS